MNEDEGLRDKHEPALAISEPARTKSLQTWESENREVQSRLQYQHDFAQSALKNLLLVNGGAILALLTLIGNSNAHFDARSIKWAFVWFGSGLAASLLAYFGAYFSQAYFMLVSQYRALNAQREYVGEVSSHDPSHLYSRGNRALWSGICMATLSLVLFVTGSFVALGGIL